MLNPPIKQVISDDDAKMLKFADSLMRTLNNPMRQRILQLLLESPGITVTEIYSKLRMTQSMGSEQLRILRKLNVVTVEMDGRKRKYSINNHVLDTALEKIKDLTSLFPQ